MVLYGIPEWNTLLQHDVTCTDFLSLEIVFGSVKTAELYGEFLENAPFLVSLQQFATGLPIVDYVNLLISFLLALRGMHFSMLIV